MAGVQLGQVISNPLSGWLCSLEYDNGWPLAFYVPGTLGIIWFTAWYFFVFDNPSSHPRIRDDEKNYILATTGKITRVPVNIYMLIFFGLVLKIKMLFLN